MNKSAKQFHWGGNGQWGKGKPGAFGSVSDISSPCLLNMIQTLASLNLSLREILVLKDCGCTCPFYCDILFGQRKGWIDRSSIPQAISCWIFGWRRIDIGIKAGGGRFKAVAFGWMRLRLQNTEGEESIILDALVVFGYSSSDVPLPLMMGNTAEMEWGVETSYKAALSVDFESIGPESAQYHQAIPIHLSFTNREDIKEMKSTWRVIPRCPLTHTFVTVLSADDSPSNAPTHLFRGPTLSGRSSPGGTQKGKQGGSVMV
uniref:Uncharacterized protein n=1 Tax=Chromera velia CCMP2878 TaxID=1169474 RepID=A0A0G4HME5_9ALVE|eukprot:Cvel_29049.t1-p1 / transcript=Cvel_29049.t1 / gene=Cvel_29049 / organism=Chromera_velia_CCMP2878 / gene_product=hypothetical protein / transcript_product=hypothetical protein / location=Cvel_scaffold3916:2368-3144(-) / protein_length=259 / sequence_SO=supercontig / SO=protein_coding / is_pseudo=false